MTHTQIQQGCCPAATGTAALDRDAGTLTVSIDCDCVCWLDARWDIQGVPSGSWTVVSGALTAPLVVP